MVVVEQSFLSIKCHVAVSSVASRTFFKIQLNSKEEAYMSTLSWRNFALRKIISLVYPNYENSGIF